MRKNIVAYALVLLASGSLYMFFERKSIGTVFAVLLLYGIFSVISVVLIKYSVKAELTSTEVVEKGETAEAIIKIKNLSYFPIFCCRLELIAENILTGAKSDMTRNVVLMPRKEVKYAFTFSDEACGVIRVKIRSVCASDPLGIFDKNIIFDSGANGGEACGETLVMPEIYQIPIDRSDLEKYDMESFRYAEGKRGTDPGEIIGISPYVPGDSIKNIHWKLSCKMDEIVIRELGLPVESRIMMIADKSCDARYAGALTDFFLSVSSALIKAGVLHAVGWYDYETEKFMHRRIDCEDDIAGMIELLCRSPFKKDGNTSAAYYLESEVPKDYTSYIYVTESNEAEAEIEELREYGEVSVYKTEKIKD